MRFSRTNMRLAAATRWRLSTKIAAHAAEFSITHLLPKNAGLMKSSTYTRENAKTGPALFKLSQTPASVVERLAACEIALCHRKNIDLGFWYGMEPGTRMNMARATPIAAAIL